MRKRLGDPVRKGDILAEFHVNSKDNLQEAVERFKGAVKIGEEKPAPHKLINSLVC